MTKMIELPELKIETEDDILEKATRNQHVQRVQRSGVRTGAIQSHDARAWTQSGNVD